MRLLMLTPPADEKNVYFGILSYMKVERSNQVRNNSIFCIVEKEEKRALMPPVDERKGWLLRLIGER